MEISEEWLCGKKYIRTEDDNKPERDELCSQAGVWDTP